MDSVPSCLEEQMVSGAKHLQWIVAGPQTIHSGLFAFDVETEAAVDFKGTAQCG